jgi:hypothetical protein
MSGGIVFAFILGSTQKFVNRVVLFGLLSLFLLIKIMDSIGDEEGYKYYVPYKTFLGRASLLK